MPEEKTALFGLFNNASRFMGSLTLCHPYTGYPARFYDRTTALVPPDISWLADVEAGSVLRILDLCCGTGARSRALAAAGHKVTAVDRSADMLALAAPAEGVEYILGEADQVEEATLYDVVVIAGLSLSEFSPAARQSLFLAAHNYLVSGGLIVADAAHPDLYETGPGYTILPLPEGNEGYALLGTYSPGSGRPVLQNLLIELEHPDSAPVRVLSSTWIHPATEETLRAELESAGFDDVRLGSTEKRTISIRARRPVDGPENPNKSPSTAQKETT